MEVCYRNILREWGVKRSGWLQGVYAGHIPCWYGNDLQYNAGV